MSDIEEADHFVPPQGSISHGRRRRVLVVGMVDSIHLARWLSQFKDAGIDFLLFPSGPHRRIHPSIRLLVDGVWHSNFSMALDKPLASLVIWVLDRVHDSRIRGALIRRALASFTPDYVHSVEIQNGGYAVLAAYDKLPEESQPTLIVTNYGSDIYWFRRFKKHEMRIRRLLQICSIYSCECQRDVKLARDLGFRGRIMPVFPNSGGYVVPDTVGEVEQSHSRRTIAIKGYDGWAGRAKVALSAIEMLAEDLQDYQIEVYSCNASVIRLGRKIKRSTGLNLTCHKKGALSHEEMLGLFRRSVLYIGLSLTDGVSTSLLEAMAGGAIPVQTGTSCCDEWFTESGVRVDIISPEVVAEATLAAIELAKDPSIAERNKQTIREKASQEKVKEAALKYYL